MKRVFVMIIAVATLLACSEEKKKQRQMDREAMELMEITHAVLKRVNHPEIKANDIRIKYNELRQDSIEKSYEYAVYWREKSSFLADSLNKAVALADSLALVDAHQQFNKLKKKFIYEKDEFRDIGFYTHRNWGKYRPNRKTLTTGLNSHGYVYLVSRYYADDWLFHTKINVKIGDKVLSSPTVETFDDNHVTDNEGGKIWERVTYPDAKDPVTDGEEINFMEFIEE